MTIRRVIDYLRYEVDYLNVGCAFLCTFVLAIGGWVAYTELCEDTEKGELQQQTEHKRFAEQLKYRMKYSETDYSNSFRMVATPKGMRPILWGDNRETAGGWLMNDNEMQ